MATIALTSLYSESNNWPGNMLRGGDDTVITLRTSTSFSFTLGASSDFAGFTILVTGTGFTYVDGVPVSGRMSSVKIMGSNGDTVVNITNLSGDIATDLDQFYASVFGSPFDNAGPGPNGREAWDLLTIRNDIINGTSGDDQDVLVNYNQGNDIFNMRGGDDRIRGDVGNDTYNGGSGYDMLTFFDTSYNLGSNLVGGIIVDVAARTVRDPWGGLDRFTSIESFEGSRFNDVFRGSAATQDDFIGLRGNDTFRGGQRSINDAGRLTSDSFDRVSYSSDYWNGGQFGIVVDLQTKIVNGSIRGTIYDGFGNRDTVFDIEHVSGTRFDDSFTGSRANNDFWGGEGQDTYVGEGGSDRIWFDSWFGDSAPAGIEVNLTLTSGQIIDDGFGNTEDATGIEEIVGTDGDDIIVLNGAKNQVQAGRGTDTLTGGGAADTFFFINQNEANDGDRITDFQVGVDEIGFDSDFWEGMTTTIRLVNGTAATTNLGTFIFDASNDTLYWDPDGTGVKAKLAIVELTGVNSLTVGDLFAY